MNIAINCRSFLSRQYTGIGRYAYDLVKGLAEVDRQNQYHLYARKRIFDFKRRLPSFRARNFYPYIDYFNRGINRLAQRIDVYHEPSPEIIPDHEGVKVVATVHDVIFKIFPDGHTASAIELTEKKMASVLKSSARVICCSQSTRRDLKKYFDYPEEKVAVIYPSVDKNIFYLIGEKEEQLAKRFLKNKGIEQPFILSVGTIEPRKNLTNILHSFHLLRSKKRLEGQLIVVGMKGWMSEGIEDLLKLLGLKEDVIFLGYMNDQELRYLYNKAQVFLFPSLYEGFGLPIIEAFCCGAPVVTSNISSCPEVVGDAGLTVNPREPEDITKAVLKIVNDHALSQKLREKGLRRAGDFGFHKTAQETLNVYREAYEN